MNTKIEGVLKIRPKDTKKKKKTKTKKKLGRPRTRKRKKLTRADLNKLASRLTLREAVTSSVNVIGLEEMVTKQLPLETFYSKEEIEQVHEANRTIIHGKGKPTYTYVDFLEMWVNSHDLKKLYKDNSLIGEKRKDTIKKQILSPKQQRILTGRPSSPNKVRAAADHYPTPGETTVAVLKFLSLPRDTVIFEPACGRGHISKTLQYHGYRVVSSDLYDYGYGEPGIDFINTRFKDYDWIITNPPFNLAEEFIRKAYANGKPFAFLLKSTYFNAGTRRALFFETRPSHVLPLTWRPDFTFTGTSSRSTMDCSWFIWSEESFKNVKEPFVCDFYPLLKPENYPKFDVMGELKEPFNHL